MFGPIAQRCLEGRPRHGVGEPDNRDLWKVTCPAPACLPALRPFGKRALWVSGRACAGHASQSRAQR